MSDASDNWVKSSLVADACDAQRANGMLPTVRRNEEFIEDVLRELERKERDAPAKPTVKPPPPKAPEWTDAHQREYEKRAPGGVMPGKVVMERREIGTPTPRIPSPDGKLDIHERRRLAVYRRLIDIKQHLPELHRRMQLINWRAYLGHLGLEKRIKATGMLEQLFLESEKYLGPWDQPAKKPLWFA